MDVAWGGTDYDGSIIGDGSAWKEGLLKPIYRWIPSIAVSDMTFYKGNLFPDQVVFLKKEPKLDTWYLIVTLSTQIHNTK